MDTERILEKIEEEKLIAVVRLVETSDVVKRVCDSLSAGGVAVVEITTTVPDAVGTVGFLSSSPDRKFLIGAGTVTDAWTAEAMIEAGAEFIVSPAVVEEVISRAGRAGVPVFPGAMTPTEVLRAHTLGADAVKIFPASAYGPGFIKALAGPLPGIPLIPTGGVDLGNIGDYIRAGAFAVGVGGSLIDTEAVRRGDWQQVAATAAGFVDAVRAGGRTSSSGEGER